jgi:DNA polymerase IIIc chi subunit
MKCLRVLIAAFERQIKALDRHLNQWAGLDRVEIFIPHARKVPPKISRTASLLALVDQPGSSEAAPNEIV